MIKSNYLKRFKQVLLAFLTVSSGALLVACGQVNNKNSEEDTDSRIRNILDLNKERELKVYIDENKVIGTLLTLNQEELAKANEALAINAYPIVDLKNKTISVDIAVQNISDQDIKRLIFHVILGLKSEKISDKSAGLIWLNIPVVFELENDITIFKYKKVEEISQVVKSRGKSTKKITQTTTWSYNVIPSQYTVYFNADYPLIGLTQFDNLDKYLGDLDQDISVDSVLTYASLIAFDDDTIIDTNKFIIPTTTPELGEQQANPDNENQTPDINGDNSNPDSNESSNDSPKEYEQQDGN